MNGVAVPVDHASIGLNMGSGAVALLATLTILPGGKATVDLAGTTSPGNSLASTGPMDFTCAWRVMRCVRHLTGLHDDTLQTIVAFLDGSYHDDRMTKLLQLADDLDWQPDELVIEVRKLAQCWPSADDIERTLERLPQPLRDDLLLDMQRCALKGRVADRDLLAFLESPTPRRRAEVKAEDDPSPVMYHRKPGLFRRFLGH